ncbi:MAG: type II toxin-antitoxin system death-on-curing family toxin [Clostridia bacterium]|nr:type II toxin-antitoxin system death-on-curing family toxin [Clostridia bacterium]
MIFHQKIKAVLFRNSSPTFRGRSLLAEPLIKNHSFVDGNKRLWAHAMLVFLSLNRIDLEYTQDELSDIILKVAAGECGYDDLLGWIIGHQLG